MVGHITRRTPLTHSITKLPSETEVYVTHPFSNTTLPSTYIRCFLGQTGPWLWVPPKGCKLVADEPQEVKIMDIVGHQAGSSPLGRPSGGDG